MNGSVLIFGSTKNLREDKIVEIVNSQTNKDFGKVKDLSEKADIKIVELKEDEKTIGISQTREGVKFLQERPFSYEKKFLIILDAEKLTVQAQNSLLKTLEEPPLYALILLSSKTRNSLLETVVSRCRMLPVKKDRECLVVENSNSLEKILKMDFGKRLEIASEISKEEKETILELLECWVEEGRELILKKPKDENRLKNIKRIMQIKKDLENSNVNQRLSIEALVLSFSGSL
jgi:DNA polymerase III delta prime subunit